MIIGITGTLGAGKGTIVEYLKSIGFEHHSARDFINKEIQKRGLKLNRDNLVIVANELRAKHSPSYVAKGLLKKAQKHGKDAILESLRTEGEIKSLKKQKNFIMFAIDADIKKRFKRIKLRANETDKINFQKFIEDEKKEMTSTDPNKQNLKRCIEISDYKFENNGTIEELHKKVKGVLNELRK